MILPAQVDQLAPLFVACTQSDGTFETIQSLDAGLDMPVLSSSLFRQALIITAKQYENFSLAIDLIQKVPLE